MFGCYRFLLAHMVLVSHLLGYRWPGPYAVFSFWALSGYLMTLVLNRSYGFGPRGVVSYLANRALRIYPPYLLVLLGSGLVLEFAPETPFSLVVGNPSDLWGWLHNVVILGLHFDIMSPTTPVPFIWSVDIELWFYAGLALGLARGRHVALGWFVASVLYAAYLVSIGEAFPARYGNLAAASLPYSMGALIYHHREWLQSLARARIHAIAAPALYLANVCLAPLSTPVMIGFYASLGATAYVIVALGKLRASTLPPRFARLDQILGDLSYPVFLCHFSVGVLLAVAGLEVHSAEMFWWSLVPVNVLAFLVHLVAERPVETLRDRIRSRRARIPAPP